MWGREKESLCADVDQGDIVVLRSFGKFFGLAGLRLGFAVASKDVAARLDAEFGPWAVAGPAVEYGLRALKDIAWQNDMRQSLDRLAGRLDGLFARFGIVVDGGTSLFRHVTLPDASSLFRSLGEQGILLRSFADRPRALRIGLPGGEEQWLRLEAALAAWAEAKGAGGVR